MIEILHNIYNYVLNNFVFVTGVAAGMKWVYEYSQSRKFEKTNSYMRKYQVLMI